MTEREDIDNWMATLSGKKAADDANTRSAVRLRDALLPRPDESATPIDEARLRRMMNMLAAKGAFAEPVPAIASPSPKSWLDHIKTMLLGDQGWTQLGYAAAAMAVVVVMIVPSLEPRQTEPFADDSAYTKQAHIATEQRIHAASPADAAAQLSQALRQLGLNAEVQPSGAGYSVRATVPTVQRAQVEQALMELGLSLPTDGHLSVVFVSVAHVESARP